MNSGSLRAAGNVISVVVLRSPSTPPKPNLPFLQMSLCVCLPIWSTKGLESRQNKSQGTLQQKMLSSPQHPSTIRQSILQKLNEFGSEVFFLIHHIHPISCQQDPIFFQASPHFVQGERFHSQQDAEDAFKEFTENQSTCDFGVL